MAKDPAAQLAQLAYTAKGLSASLVSYQRALMAARAAGATWPQIAACLSTSEGCARWRHKAAQVGGEIHLRLFPVEDNGNDQL